MTALNVVLILVACVIALGVMFEVRAHNDTKRQLKLMATRYSSMRPFYRFAKDSLWYLQGSRNATGMSLCARLQNMLAQYDRESQEGGWHGTGY